jgi:hypothetical protein
MLTLEFEIEGNGAVSVLGVGEREALPEGATGDQKLFVRNNAGLGALPGSEDERVRTSMVLVRGAAAGAPEVTGTVVEFR